MKRGAISLAMEMEIKSIVLSMRLAKARKFYPAHGCGCANRSSLSGGQLAGSIQMLNASTPNPATSHLGTDPAETLGHVHKCVSQH